MPVTAVALIAAAVLHALTVELLAELLTWAVVVRRARRPPARKSVLLHQIWRRRMDFDQLP